MKPVSTGKWLIIGLLAVMAVLSFLVGATLIVSSSGAASSQDVKAQGERRDCVTHISTARRSVFDNVDIYKAESIRMFDTFTIDRYLGRTYTPAEVDRLAKEYQANDAKLGDALVEARRLQPARTLDDLIAHGGMIDGIHYEACPQ